jgi:hypothetical protein
MTTYGVDRTGGSGGSGSSSTVVFADGSVPLTADWDIGPNKLTAEQLESDVATGTAPFVVASTTKVDNLNADLLDDQTGSYYLTHANMTDLASGDGHTQYVLLAGRATGQTIVGGTASGDDLTLNSTSHGTKGDVFVQTAGGDLTLGGGATASKLKMLEPSGSGSNYTAFAAQAQSADIDYTLPAAAPTLNQAVLTSNSSGAMSWGSHQAGRNAIINGAFDIWQRGTSFAAIADQAYAADRWTYGKSADTAVHTISQSSDIPTVAQAGILAPYSMLVDCTTSEAAFSAAQYCVLTQRIEGYTWRSFAQRALTLSFWVKATKTGTYCVALVNSNGDRSIVQEYTVSAADTWEKKTINFQASPSAGTWLYTSGIGASLYFVLGAGSNFNSTAGSWQSSVSYGISTANQVNGCDSDTNNFRLALVQLEVGDVATDFEMRWLPDELMRCQRYYQTVAQWINHETNAANGQSPIKSWTFATTMRTTPTVTYANTGYQSGSTVTTNNAAADQVRVQFTTTANGSCYVLTDIIASAEL